MVHALIELNAIKTPIVTKTVLVLKDFIIHKVIVQNVVQDVYNAQIIKLVFYAT